jgi:hypothetical protein
MFDVPEERNTCGRAQRLKWSMPIRLSMTTLPAMDDDDMRRGRPSCHIAFDEATAILAGRCAADVVFRSAGR